MAIRYAFKKLTRWADVRAKPHFSLEARPGTFEISIRVDAQGNAHHILFNLVPKFHFSDFGILLRLGGSEPSGAVRRKRRVCGGLTRRRSSNGDWPRPRGFAWLGCTWKGWLAVRPAGTTTFITGRRASRRRLCRRPWRWRHRHRERPTRHRWHRRHGLARHDDDVFSAAHSGNRDRPLIEEDGKLLREPQPERTVVDLTAWRALCVGLATPQCRPPPRPSSSARRSRATTRARPRPSSSRRPAPSSSSRACAQRCCASRSNCVPRSPRRRRSSAGSPRSRRCCGSRRRRRRRPHASARSCRQNCRTPSATSCGCRRRRRAGRRSRPRREVGMLAKQISFDRDRRRRSGARGLGIRGVASTSTNPPASPPRSPTSPPRSSAVVATDRAPPRAAVVADHPLAARRPADVGCQAEAASAPAAHRAVHRRARRARRRRSMLKQPHHRLPRPPPCARRRAGRRARRRARRSPRRRGRGRARRRPAHLPRRRAASAMCASSARA